MDEQWEALQGAQTPAEVRVAARALEVVLGVASAEAPKTTGEVAAASLEEIRQMKAGEVMLLDEVHALREELSAGLRVGPSSERSPERY